MCQRSCAGWNCGLPGRRHFPCHTPVPSVPGIHLLQRPSVQGSAWPCRDKLRDFFGEEKLDFFDCLLCEASVKERILPACFPEQAFMADTLQKANHTAELFGFSRSLSSISEMGRAPNRTKFIYLFIFNCHSAFTLCVKCLVKRDLSQQALQAALERCTKSCSSPPFC